jgi:glyoxylase-like metal-dependent hydrolase (beta-lactamase superfamily II)
MTVKRVCTPLCLSLFALSCQSAVPARAPIAAPQGEHVAPAPAPAPPPSADPVDRAFAAMGGPEALSGLKTLSVKGTITEWEPEQSLVADGEPRLASESSFEAISDLGADATRIDWVRKFVYPMPRTYTFREILTPQAGFVAGIDSTARTKQSQESNPPGHTMSGLRLAASRRELRRASPLLVLELMKNRDHVSSLGDVIVAGTAYPAVEFKDGADAFDILFDPKTALPARIRTLDYDGIWGDVTYDLVLSDWRRVDKLQAPFGRTYELNGRKVADIKIDEIRANGPLPPEPITVPASLADSASKPPTGFVPYQWVLRRQFIGTYLDSDNPSVDVRAGAALHFKELAPGVEHLVGGTHNSLVVEMRDYLVVFDAPVSDAQSKFALDAAREKFKGKPVKYLVLTHHHMDHAGGLRAYAAQGATLVVGKGNADHFRKVLAAPFTRNPDLPAQDLSQTPIVEVTDKQVLTDGRRQVSVYLLENPHADGLLMGYVSDAKIGWVVDIWNPGREPLPEKITPPLAALVAGVKKASIAPLKFAGGHGSTSDYAPLAALAAKK